MTQLTLEDFSSNCGICSLKFLTKNSVIYHQKIEHRVGVDRTIECEKCQKVIKPANLKAHMKIHMEKALQCKLCYKMFGFRSHLNEHQTGVHKNETQYLDREILDSELIYNCDECNKLFVSQHSLLTHRRHHDIEKFEHLRTESYLKSAKRYECKLCYSTYESFTNLLAHFNTAHKSDKERIHEKIITADLVFPCNDCDLSFITQNVLNFHNHKVHRTKINEKSTAQKDPKEPQVCRLCYKVFSCRRDVVQHEKGVHVKEAKYLQREILDSELVHTCDLCDMKFVTNNLLVSHTKKHDMEKYEPLRREAYDKNKKRYNCKLCYRSLQRFADVIAHIEFAHKSDLERIHEQINTADLSFSCDGCNLTFISNDILNYHKSRSHTERTEKCIHCPEVFKYHNTLRKHSLSVHKIRITQNIKTFNCKLCRRPLRGKGNLRAHEKKLHTTPEEMHALSLDVIEEHTLAANCSYCGKNFLNNRTLEIHNGFCNGKRTENLKKVTKGSGRYSGIYAGKKDCALCLINFDTTGGFQQHVQNMHRNFSEEIAAFKSLQIGEKISLHSQCKFCQKELLNGHVLKCHYEKIHRIEESKKNWECEFCKKEFKPEKRRRTTVGAHMRDEHDLPEYNCLDMKIGNGTKKTGSGNQAKQNFQLMLAKMLGMRA